MKGFISLLMRKSMELSRKPMTESKRRGTLHLKAMNLVESCSFASPILALDNSQEAEHSLRVESA